MKKLLAKLSSIFSQTPSQSIKSRGAQERAAIADAYIAGVDARLSQRQAAGSQKLIAHIARKFSLSQEVAEEKLKEGEALRKQKEKNALIEYGRHLEKIGMPIPDSHETFFENIEKYSSFNPNFILDGSQELFFNGGVLEHRWTNKDS